MGFLYLVHALLHFVDRLLQNVEKLLYVIQSQDLGDSTDLEVIDALKEPLDLLGTLTEVGNQGVRRGCSVRSQLRHS